MTPHIFYIVEHLARFVLRKYDAVNLRLVPLKIDMIIVLPTLVAGTSDDFEESEKEDRRPLSPVNVSNCFRNLLY